jgi:hypothetical protein
VRGANDLSGIAQLYAVLLHFVIAEFYLLAGDKVRRAAMPGLFTISDANF